MSDLGRGDQWERDALYDLASAGLREQRRARRWGIFFKFLIFIYIGFILFMSSDYAPSRGLPTGEHTALVDLVGVIADGEDASADNVVAGLRKAFESTQSAAVILRINSPGGSPVQAAYINDEIVRLRGLYPDKPLYVVISDICASGGIYAAASADKIFANPASIVGSIGVRMDGFGFVDTIEKLGMERRLMTAGEHKAVLDPFLPENDFEKRHVQGLLDSIHQQFIDTVKAGRGDRLADDPKLYSGLFWTGAEAKELGLIDEFGSASYVAREVVGKEDIVNYTYQRDFLEKFANRLGSAMMNQLELSSKIPTLK